MTDDTRTPTAQRPCGHVFAGGLPCNAPESHAVHRGEWRGPEPDHDYVPLERRCGQDRRSAEARDATGLRLDADLTERLSDHFGHAHSTYACNCGDRFRAALATAPPEPRWPSRDELAKALRSVMAQRMDWHTTWEQQPEGVRRSYYAEADAILAALREGGERA